MCTYEYNTLYKLIYLNSNISVLSSWNNIQNWNESNESVNYHENVILQVKGKMTGIIISVNFDIRHTNKEIWIGN